MNAINRHRPAGPRASARRAITLDLSPREMRHLMAIIAREGAHAAASARSSDASDGAIARSDRLAHIEREMHRAAQIAEIFG
jgi:hypothetical protein